MDLKNPNDFLLAAQLAGTSDGLIEASERQGQREATSCGKSRSVMLPANLEKNNYSRKYLVKTCLESLGIGFPGGGDDVLQPAELPPGWRLEPTDHAMWSDLIDANGNKRGSMFYKAAFYDRDAHVRLESRYIATSEFGEKDEDYKLIDKGKYRRPIVCDGQTDEHLHEGDWQGDLPSGGQEELSAYWQACDAADNAESTWLSENFPDHEDPLAYWDPQPELPEDECEISGCTREDDEDILRDKAKEHGYVPDGCLLDGMLVMFLNKTGEDPCAGCHENRDKCGGRAKR